LLQHDALLRTARFLEVHPVLFLEVHPVLFLEVHPVLNVIPAKAGIPQVREIIQIYQKSFPRKRESYRMLPLQDPRLRGDDINNPASEH